MSNNKKSLNCFVMISLIFAFKYKEIENSTKIQNFFPIVFLIALIRNRY